jgi:hypothetical protein
MPNTICRSFQEGSRIDHTPSADLGAGVIVVLNVGAGQNRIKGVATSDIPANTPGSLDATHGRIYECAFVPGSNLVDMQDIFVEPDGDLVLTSNSGANPKFGQCVGAYLAAATAVLVRATFLLLFMLGVALGQDCADGQCIPVEANVIVADTPHVRCMVGNSCGSGTICGFDETGAYVLSNAHVWGTQLGKVVNIDAVVGGVQKRTQGRLVFAGYSSTRMVDFAIALCPNLKSERYMPLLKTEPASPPYATTGSPRCVWPQVLKQFGDPRNYGDGLMTGLPDAIGGQSGSAIYNSAGQQIALLTWSINGRCAGQKTSKLWQVATTRNVLLADMRPEGLKEMSGPFLEEGVFGLLPFVQEVQSGSVRPVTDNVIASIANSSMEQMPIWANPKQPEPDCFELTEQEKELIEFLRKQAETGVGETKYNWAEIIRLVLELIAIINKKGN